MLRVVSDLHLELMRNVEYHPSLKKIQTLHRQSDVKYYLALLGDIGNPFHLNLQTFLSEVSQVYDKVFYVPGNHEYYTGHTMEVTNQQMQKICDRLGIELLMNRSYQLDGIKLIGSTLWSHIDDKKYEFAISDYSMIFKTPNEFLTIEDTNRLNQECIDFIRQEIPSGCDIIVLTHHAPLFNNPEDGDFCSDPKYTNSQYTQAFHNNLSELIKPPIKAWFYGHTHYVSSFWINGVWVATNQLGYHNERYKIKFDPEMLYSLESK